MADALVEPGDEMTLLITNHRMEPVQLEVGEVTRRLQPARVVELQSVGGDSRRNAEDGRMVLEVVDGGVRVEDVVVPETVARGVCHKRSDSTNDSEVAGQGSHQQTWCPTPVAIGSWTFIPLTFDYRSL